MIVSQVIAGGDTGVFTFGPYPPNTCITGFTVINYSNPQNSTPHSFNVALAPAPVSAAAQVAALPRRLFTADAQMPFVSTPMEIPAHLSTTSANRYVTVVITNNDGFTSLSVTVLPHIFNRALNN